MPTQCSFPALDFQAPGRRQIRALFDGGLITSDGGAVLLGELERRLGLVARFAQCFVDHRDPGRIEHSVEELVKQRVFGLVLGYEDLNDHDLLRRDPVLALIAGKRDPVGRFRRLERDRGVALASRSTLNRLEGARSGRADRYHRISFDEEQTDQAFVDVFLGSYPKPPGRIILDLDATDDPIHGEQEGRFFHGYYDRYCYLPLYIFCGHHLLSARLRSSNIDASAGSTEEVERLVGRIRTRWPEVKILLRADSAFARERLMRWCEDHSVDYVFGLARNARLVDMIKPLAQRTKDEARSRGKPVRHFAELTYRTQDSWSRSRRVVAKVEHLPKGANPRFVVTSLSREQLQARPLYEKLYCARGEMENRIKEQQLDLFADRTSCHVMRANQLRLYLSSMAYVVFDHLRRLALHSTAWARARAATIRRKLFKIGALVRPTVRRIWIHFSSAYPYQQAFTAAYATLQQVPMRC